MLSRKMIALFVTLISVLSLASTANAALISVDFNTSSGGIDGGKGPTATPASVVAAGDYSYTYPGMGTDDWNTLNVGPGGFASTISPPVATGFLVQSGGATTPVVFTITSGPAFFPYAPGSPDALRGDSVIMITGGTDTASNLNWAITGLLPGFYDLRFYGDNTPGGFGYYTVDLNHNAADDTGEAIFTNNTAEFLSVSSLGGTITGHVNRPGSNTEWAGLQIRGTFVAEAEAVPEPSTFLLAALGLTGLGLVAWRRRKANVN